MGISMQIRRVVINDKDRSKVESERVCSILLGASLASSFCQYFFVVRKEDMQVWMFRMLLE